MIALPDDEAGEIPAAYVVLKQGADVSAGDVQAFVAERVASHKQVREVTFIHAVPKSAAGKILRRILRDQAGRNDDQRLAVSPRPRSTTRASSTLKAAYRAQKNTPTIMPNQDQAAQREVIEPYSTRPGAGRRIVGFVKGAAGAEHHTDLVGVR